MRNDGYFVMDGICHDVDILSITRNFNILDTEKAGRAMGSGHMWRDIIGTFYNYTIEIDTARLNRIAYDSFYEALTAPVESHRIKALYGQSVIEFDAYVTSGSDTVRVSKNGNRWSGLSIEVVAMDPFRRP